MTVQLRWHPTGFDRQTVAVVDLRDAELRVRAQAVLQPDTVWPVDLPAGPYFAGGPLPGGRWVEAVLGAGEDVSPHVELSVSAGRPTGHAPMIEWAVPWQRVGTRWKPSGLLRDRDFHTVSAGAGAPAAIQVGDGDGPSFTVMCADDIALRLGDGVAVECETDRRRLAWTMLRHLSDGSPRAAGRLAEELLRLRSAPPSGDILADLAVGYHLLRSAHPRLRGWLRALRRAYPRCPDPVVLSVWEQLRSGRHGRRVRRDLVRAVALGPPLVAAGVRLLADALAVLPRAVADDRVDAALVVVRAYQRCLVAGPLTAYASLTPNLPLPDVTPVSTGADVRPFTIRMVGARGRVAGMLGWRRPADPQAQALDESVAVVEDLARQASQQCLPLPGSTVAALRRTVHDVLGGRVGGTNPARLWRTAPRPRWGLSMPRLELLGGRLAADSDSRLRSTWSPRQDLTFTVQQLGRGTVQVRVAGWLPSAAAVLLELSVATVGADLPYLLPLVPRHDGHRGDLELSGLDEWIELTVTGVGEIGGAAAADPHAIIRSVRATDRIGRNAWRTIAESLDPNSAQAVAIEVGLSSR